MRIHKGDSRSRIAFPTNYYFEEEKFEEKRIKELNKLKKFINPDKWEVYISSVRELKAGY